MLADYENNHISDLLRDSISQFVTDFTEPLDTGDLGSLSRGDKVDLEEWLRYCLTTSPIPHPG